MTVKRKLKANTYRVLQRAIEEGIPWGINRYYKYRPDEPEVTSRDDLAEQILDAIMLEVCDVIMFNEEE